MIHVVQYQTYKEINKPDKRCHLLPEEDHRTAAKGYNTR